MIGKRDGKFYARVHLGGGRYKWLGTHKTRREAKDAEREFQTKQQPAREETCDSFASRWLDAYPRAAPGTRRTYESAAARFGREFRGVSLSDVDRLRAREWALDAPASVVAAVRAMFTDALNDGLVLANPFTSLRLSRSRGRKDIHALTEEELHALAAKAPHDEFGSLILVAGYTGMRAGELCALEWGDIDGTTIRVSRGLDRTGHTGPPKNGQSRIITCPPPAREAFAHVSRSLGDSLVFHSPRGKQLNVGTIGYYLRSMGRPITFHELRHCCATILLERGVGHADVALQLGHTDGGRLVMELYGHPSEDAARARLRGAWTATPLRRDAIQTQRKANHQ